MISSMNVSQIKIGKRFRVDLGDVKALADDIDEVGLLQPIVVQKSGHLIAGARRLAAWKQSRHSSESIPVHVVDLEKIARGEWSENIHRKSFTPSEAVAIARAIEPIVRHEAKRRQSMGAGRKLPRSERADTRDILAKHCGMSARSLQKAMIVITAAATDPALKPIALEMDVSGKIDLAFRKIEQRKRKRTPPTIEAASIFDSEFRFRPGELKRVEITCWRRFFELLDEEVGQPSDASQSLREFVSEKLLIRASKFLGSASVGRLR